MTAPLVFITGASSGIGQALAARYHRAGWRLALVARRTQEIKSWADACSISADSYEIYSADVAQPDSIAAAGQICMQRQGVPDVVIANAGISVGVDTALREDIATMAQVLATNTVGTAATFQPFITPMVQRGSGRLGPTARARQRSSAIARACAANCAAPVWGSVPSARVTSTRP
jgi:NADP-dependent 3-hydroxy acid dehydrogenase YdfG